MVSFAGEVLLEGVVECGVVVFGGEVDGGVEGYLVFASVGGSPEEGAVGESDDVVAVFVAEAVVVSAGGFEVFWGGGSVVGPHLVVVVVAGGGGVWAAGGAAGDVAGFDEGVVGGSGSSGEGDAA